MLLYVKATHGTAQEHICVPQVRARLEAKERAVLGRAERDIEMMEKDLKELRRRDQEIIELLQTEDSSHFLQVREAVGNTEMGNGQI